MTTPALESESRRRLPRAPSIDVRSSEVIKRRVSDMEQKQQDMIAKKRLTPEVVAMLLSLEYERETTGNSNKALHNDISTRSGGEMTQTSNSKVVLQDNIGLVNILKTSGQPLGFSLREYNVYKNEQPGGIFVSRLTPGGVAQENLLLSTGDEILEINRVAVKDYKLSDVVAMIQIPKKLTLKVRFRRSMEVSKESPLEKSKQDVRNVNNNYIVNEQNHKLVKTGPKQSTQISTQGNVVRETATGALKFRQNSSGRILPAPPESDKPGHSVRCENHSQNLNSNIVPSTEARQKQKNCRNIDIQPTLNSNFDNNNENNHSRQRTLQSRINNVNLISEYQTSASKQNSQKRSTVIPVSVNVRKHSQVKGRGDSEDGEAKRLDPGDIKFDIVATNDPKTTSCAFEKVKIEPMDTSTSGKTSEMCGSSSSLSSSDSPKCGKSKNSLAGLQLSRSELLTHSSRLSDGSSVSSSAESEDQIVKSEIKCNQRPLLLHCKSSDDLNLSHNSWFSRIGNQRRKHVRKFSEGTRPLSKSSVGEPYRIQKSMETDDAEHGYRLYAGSTQPTPRAVTGMLTLDIVKGAQIESPENKKKAKVFCSVDSDGVRQASTVPKKGLNDFEWKESFEIELQRTRELRITVYTRFKKEEVKLAESCLNLAQLLSEGSEHLLAICLEPAGLLCVKLKFTDMKSLLQRTPSQRQEGVFGVPVETVLRRENSKVPNIVRKCVEEINERGLELTGIYRICGNAAKKKVVRAQFENNSASVDLSQTENLVDVNIITGLLKDYLRELPQPLLSQDVRELLSKVNPETTTDNLVSQITKMFPRPSKATIIYLLDHFVTVVMNSGANKMDSHNLAVCIGPVLLCPSLGGTTTVSDTKKDINAIKLLLEIWPKPEQISAC